MLTAEAQQAIHAAIAIQMLAKRYIDARDANGILMHALLGKEVHSLFQLAYSVLTAKAKAVELLREHIFMLPILRTDLPIFADNRMVSVMLRLAAIARLEHSDWAALICSRLCSFAPA
jgi:hypothetical protein